MATNDRTHAGEPGPVLSYLGHPCHLADLRCNYTDETERQRLAGQDPRHLAQRLGDQLKQLRRRLNCAQVSLGQLGDMAKAEAEHHDIECTAEVLSEYLEETAQLAYMLATHAIVVLDRAGITEASQQQRAEPAHG